jgi:hypothetical protein
MSANLNATRPEDLWEDILSRQPDRIQAAFAGLDRSEQANVLAHLQRMSTEEGWHPEQRQSALAAVSALADEGL